MGIGDTNSRCLVVLVVIFFPVLYEFFFGTRPGLAIMCLVNYLHH